MPTLTFDKLSQFDRLQEPVTVSVPFGPGSLSDPDRVLILDGTTPLPTQRRVLARWADGTVKWLLIHLQPDLPGNRSHRLRLAVDGEARPPAPSHRVVLSESPTGIRVDTGPLQFTVPTDGFLPLREICLNHRSLWDQEPFAGFRLQVAGQILSSATGPVVLEIEEAGPLRAVILVRGKHVAADGSGYLDLNGRITAYAGKPFVEIEHQFIHAEEEPELALESLTLAFRPQPSGAPRLALGQGYYRTMVTESTDRVEMALTAETMLYQSNEHFVDSFYGDFWVDWRDGQSGMALSVYQAHQNFPKTLTAEKGGILCALYPADAQPAPILQGMGKSHRLQLHFHGPQKPLEELSVRSLQFQLPDRPHLPRDWYRHNNPWVESFFPEALPGRLITFLNRLHDGRPKALGMLHFGDAPDAGYTDQGRGGGETVWVNNEYDRPHACSLYYALTGQRRVLDSALVCARHWLDVDLCHYSPDPLLHGGLKIHTRGHVTGRVTPSHEWTEGLLDYYFWTGREEGRDAAISVGENIMRHMAQPHMRARGATSVREGGWALRAMVGLWLGTGEDRWRKEAQRLVELFLGWHREFGALLAPYTSHTMPRVPFMIALTVNSFARYLLIQEDERVKALIVETVDDLVAHCLGPDGIFYYKELPSLGRTAPTPHVLESLTYAYRITGDEAYLKVAARQFAALTAGASGVERGPKTLDASGAVIEGVGGGRIFADKYTSLILFAQAAAPLGFLDWYEYPFPQL